MRKRKKWPVFIIYGIALAVCAVLIYVVPSVLGVFDLTYIAKYGQIEVSSDAEVYIFREDRVYVADQAGEINRLVPEGELVKGKSRIVELTGDGKEHTAGKYDDILKSLGKNISVAEGGVSDRSGFVSYQVDGLEGAFTVENIDNVTRSSLEELSGKPTEVQSGRCAKGDPVFRIASNGNWYLLFWAEPEQAREFVEGDDITIVIGDDQLDAQVVTVKIGKEISRVVVRTNTFNHELLNNRTLKVHFITSKANGVILQSHSIIEKDGVKGVLVRDKVGDNQFKPVRIKADNGTEAAVYSDFFMDDNMEFVETVKTYDEVVISPTEEEIAAAVDVNDKYK